MRRTRVVALGFSLLASFAFAASVSTSGSLAAQQLRKAWIVITPSMGNSCGEGCDYEGFWKSPSSKQYLLRITDKFPRYKWDLFRKSREANGHLGLIYVGPYPSCAGTTADVTWLKEDVILQGIVFARCELH